VGVHGDVANPPADETAPIAPGDVYQATKAEAEALAFDFHRRRGLPVAVVRPGAIYGPGETRLLKLFRWIARGRYAVVGSGRSFYHPVYIDDLLEGFLLALERPQAVGEAFLIAGPRYVSQAELARLIAQATGGRVLPFRIPAAPLQWAGHLCEAICVPLGFEPPLHRRRVDFWTKSRAFSIEKARRLLGYDPKVDLEEGIARTVAAYRRAGWI
jgi:nucleoside-diphosphate-sugar epimerase